MPSGAGFLSAKVIGADKLRRALAKYPRELHRELHEGFVDIGNAMVEAVQRRVEGSPLRSRSGMLKRSFGKRVMGNDLRSLKLRVYSAGVPYAVWHAIKGPDIIRPKRAKYLTIPTKHAMTSAGRPKAGMASARQWMEAHKGEWFISKGTIFKRKFRSTGSRSGAQVGFGKPVPLWSLKKQVRVPRGRLQWTQTWRKLADMRKRTYIEASRTARRRAGL